jgi:hypothetical protein
MAGKSTGFGTRLASDRYMPLKYSEDSVDKSPLRSADLRY